MKVTPMVGQSFSSGKTDLMMNNLHVTICIRIDVRTRRHRISRAFRLL